MNGPNRKDGRRHRQCGRALRAARGATVVGIGISVELVRQAKTLWQEDVRSILFTVGDAEELGIRSDTADVCFFGGSYTSELRCSIEVGLSHPQGGRQVRSDRS